jgi:hypothetical protein
VRWGGRPDDSQIYLKEKGTDLFKKERKGREKGTDLFREKRGRIYLSAIHNKEG